MDAEKIILTKNFYELTPSEKEAIKDYAQNETDFNEIKSFLLATKQTFEQQKLQVSDNLSQSILNHLHQPVEQKKTWYNTLMLFLFPEQKRFYQYPAFQIAFASLLILFIINVIPGISNDEQLAVNEEISPTKQEQKVNDEDFLENEAFYDEEIIERTQNDSILNNITNKETTSTGSKNLEVQSPPHINTPILDKEISLEVEIPEEITNTVTSSSIQTKEVIELEDDNVVTDELITEVVLKEKTNKKKIENNKRATKAYNLSENSQPSTSMESEKDIYIEKLPIKSTPQIITLFYISK